MKSQDHRARPVQIYLARFLKIIKHGKGRTREGGGGGGGEGNDHNQ